MPAGDAFVHPVGDLVVVHGAEPSSRRPLILPALSGGAVARLVQRMLVRAPSHVHALVLRPPEGAELASWHADAWRALPGDVREAVVLVSGPTAFWMRRLVDHPRVTLVVSPPDEIAFADPRRVTKALRQPEETDAVLTAIANPHARMVLAEPIAEQAATAEQIQARADKIARAVRLSPFDALGALAVNLAERLDCDRAYAEWEAVAVTAEIQAEAADVRLSDAASDRLWAFNQLDAALWERAQGPRGAKP